MAHPISIAATKAAGIAALFVVALIAHMAVMFCVMTNEPIGLFFDTLIRGGS